MICFQLKGFQLKSFQLNSQIANTWWQLPSSWKCQYNNYTILFRTERRVPTLRPDEVSLNIYKMYAEKINAEK